MMTSAEIRKGFTDFYKKHDHAIVPSSSLMPESPNLLFTNAGMNQFVPIFLGQVKCPYPTHRAADTQKCIRAGGKHNDLDDVGFDTYHHTFFEMLGNWSFGDYFKKESLEWGWELLTKVWGFPKERLYATVYKPSKAGDPAEFDQEAYDVWEAIFKKEGMDPAVHIKFGGKKDNFWMMGDTGPCGPCSEIHIDLTPKGDTQGSLVNQSSSRCIEIWNHVFMQFNATSDGRFEPLPAKSVDTGMGFERAAGIVATTKNFTDFSAEPSNYNSDLFTSIFAEIESLSGKKYTRTVPAKREGLTEQEQIDVAFRVLADHARCVSCAIADGIIPSNEGRNYVIRRILRRAIMYGRKLGLKIGDFAKLSGKVVENLGPIFPELKKQQAIVAKIILSEEESFGRTLQKGLQEFERHAAAGKISGAAAFELYDTYGFPLDLTEVLAVERGLTVDKAGFEAEMNKQQERSRSSQKKSEVIVSSGTAHKTKFVGYEAKNLTGFTAKVLAAESGKYIVTNESPFYAEMGGQVGDTGTIEYKGHALAVVETKLDANGQVLHIVKEKFEIAAGATVTMSVDVARRANIACHHSATHLLDWALRTKLGGHIRQAGSLVGPERLRFDFNHFEAVGPEVLRELETQINAAILANSEIKTTEVPYSQKPADVVAVFGEKYGDTVRVVDIGGFSKELCGGTHASRTGDIGLFKFVSEGAIAAGVRRIEAVVGAAAVAHVQAQEDAIKAVAAELVCGTQEVEAKLKTLKDQKATAETELKALRQKALAGVKAELFQKAVKVGELTLVKAVLPDATPDDLKNLSQMILGELTDGAVVLGSVHEGKASVLAAGTKEAVAKGWNSGKVITELTAALDGRGGGRPELSMGSGKATDKLAQVVQAYTPNA
jgi:alanyl-tRNA synthetase